MTKNKHLKLESREGCLKRKKVESNDNEVQIEASTAKKANKKRKKNKLEEAPSKIPDVPRNETQKNKKHKKKNKTEPCEISDPPSCPDEIAHQGEEDLSPEERRVLDRKMKKILKKEEKKRLRQEGETLPQTEAVAPTAARQALDYLTCWAENRREWKFQKTRQTWLLQHMFDSDKIPDEKFTVLLQYLEGLRGAAKDTTVQKALVLVQQSGEAPDDTAVQQRAQRAREVIQLLS